MLLDNTSASILVSSNCLDNSCLGPLPNLLLHLKQKANCHQYKSQVYGVIYFCMVSHICSHLGLSDLALPLVHGPACIHSWPGVTADSPGQDRVPAPVLPLGSLFVSVCHLTWKRVSKPEVCGVHFQMNLYVNNVLDSKQYSSFGWKVCCTVCKYYDFGVHKP